MSKQMNRTMTKDERRRERREEQKRREAERLRAARNKRYMLIGAFVVFVLIIGVSAYVLSRLPSSNTQGSTSPSGTPINTQVNPPVDNISCQGAEQLAFHIHAHLSIYINGSPVQVSQGVGIAQDQSCFYWLHTHDSTGVIHIESPNPGAVYTLGTFVHLWAEQFPELQYPSQLDLTSGWVAYVNGQQYKGDFHKIPLTEHELITIAYNSPGIQPDTTYSWGAGL
ncbi:MAG TPA: hypothetical protein VFB60_14780 [Ktedonobacteraceae bacterium]|nr:hypothetical protein [Ktedonobacteraceae bacterium]